METFGSFSYGVAGVAFVLLAVLLCVGWRRLGKGLALIVAVGLTAAWAFTLGYYAAVGSPPGAFALIAECTRDFAWAVFLLAIVRERISRRTFWLTHALFAAAVLHVLFGGSVLYSDLGLAVQAVAIQFLLISVLALVLIEQIYRNVRLGRRREVGYLCIGLGGMFAYDLALYAHATLLQDVSPELWYLRGLVNAAMTPFIAVAARRNTDWNFDIFVSRKVVFYSTTFVASGVYFIAMAVAGYYIRLRGGVWGSALTAVFILAAAAIFLAAIYSARVAGSWRVFLSKHFYRNKYEYRDEWLRLIGTLANDASGTPLRDRAVRAMAQIVGADSGVLWQRSEDGDYAPTGGWNTGDPGVVISRGEELVEFLLRRYWIVDTRELTRNPDHYGGLHLPASIAGKARRLIVPLLQNNDMPGFIVLDEPANTFELNYEDYDLLKTVGQQVASYLAEEQAEELLAQARQFEAYNKLTSFIMHDLKNVIAQQSLVVRNAAKFKHDPAFVEDTIRTIENSVDRMQHLLGLLQRGGVAEPRVASLAAVLDEVRAQCSNRSPVPLIQAPDRSLLVRVDSERLTAVIGHLVRNAQEATAKTGEVRLELLRVDDRAVIKVVDNGSGMDAEFVRRRLFRPFDTTKGAQGMGIGAFQAREFVRQSGGQLMVTSAVGVGTTITIELPLAVDAGAAARTSSGVR